MGASKSDSLAKKARNWVCAGFCGLAGIAFIIGGILVLLLFRDFVDGMIKKELPLRAGSQLTESWLNPPIKPLLRLYFFNTTNPDGFLKGEKPFLFEMGPYTWEETWEKVGVVWAEDGNSVKYSIKKTYRFRRDLSIGGEEDRITVPNIPMFASVDQMKWAGKLVQQALGSMLSILKQDVFNSTTVGDIVWGYDHPLIKLGNDVLPPEKKLPFNQFGFFVDKNNSAEGVYEASTGLGDLGRLGSLLSYQGKNMMQFWASEECNQIKGTDGSIFHPDVLRNQTLFIFNMNLCQSLPLVYQEDVLHRGINTYRFVPPSNVFGTPEENPRNQCFCEDGQCAPSGLFNVSKCQFGSPTMLSWPHFYQADPAVAEKVDGLNPSKEKHQFHLDIIPEMGVGMRAAVRSQVNLVMSAVEHVPQLQGVRDLVYPIFWFQDGLDELDDEEAISLLHLALHTPETARSVMYPTFFVVGALFLLATSAFLVKKHILLLKRDRYDSSEFQLKNEAKNNPEQGSRTPPPDYDNSP